MQAPGTGTEFHIRALRVLRVRLGAVPNTSAAVNALLTVKGRNSVFSGSNGLSRTDFYANLGFTIPAKMRIEENDMVRVTWGCLNLASQKKRVLMGDQKFPVIRNCRPTGPFHQGIVQRKPLG
jgi:hypothetical protein